MDDCSRLPLLRELNIPYYVQIYDIVYDMIRDGSLGEGDTLPGENVLASYWNVSRSTVRMAVRKLEEDGFIYKMQGKKTTITGEMARKKKETAQIANPCITGCQGEITRKEAAISIQNGGKLVGDLLGLERQTFIAVAVDIKYYVGDVHVASSVTIVPVVEFEKAGISIDDKEEIERMVLDRLYERARQSTLSMSVMEWSKEETDKPECDVLIVMNEVLEEEDHPISYHKYWMDSNWYRFVIHLRK